MIHAAECARPASFVQAGSSEIFTLLIAVKNNSGGISPVLITGESW